jgi:hypothetical protein
VELGLEEQIWDVEGDIIYPDGTKVFWEDGLHLTGASVNFMIFVLLRDQWTSDFLPHGFRYVLCFASW